MNARVYRLASELAALGVDAKGNLVELRNLVTGHDYAGGQGLWRLIYAHDEVLEEEIVAGDCDVQVAQPAPDALRLVYTQMRAVTGAVEDFALTIDIRLTGDTCEFRAELANRSRLNRTIREFDFPTIRNLRMAPGQCLYCGATRIEDLPAAIARNHTGYVAADHTGINLPLYADGMANDGFAVFANAADGLYLGDHNPTFEIASHLFRKRGGEIDAAIHLSPCLAPGQSRRYESYVVSPYAGDWHGGARKYRQWADTWFKPLPRPASLAQGFKGWYRLIMRHQYGKVLFRYDDLPRILKSMQGTGIDTLFMFGWHRHGHDAGYPDYAFDESQGGQAALREQVRRFQAGGGKLILYFSGRLMDTASEFFRSRGKDLCIVGCDGHPLIDRYLFEGPGVDMRHRFGHKSFGLACPHCREWMDLLKQHIDKAIDLGADGVFFDQVGFAERPCYGVGHGHPVPSLDGRAVRMAQLRELRDYLKQRRPEMSFGIECLQHFSCGFADYVHCYPGYNSAANDWLGKGEKPKLTTFIEMFRYTFPEVLISDREIRDDTDVERRVNLSILRGMFSDVEVHRCRTLIDEGAPHYREYLVKANRLRDRFGRLLLQGLFRDTDGGTCDNPEVSWAVFTAGRDAAIVATQSHLAETRANFRLPGYELQESGSLSDDAVSAGSGDRLSLTLPRHALAVAVFRRA